MAAQTSPKAPVGMNRRAFAFIIFTAFLSTMGIGLINPVAPYLIARYVGEGGNSGVILGWLSSAYAICQFVAAPGLGVLSDRYGRRPILLFCLLGSAVGYLLLGVGGALWVLFLGRIIDGITGGNFGVAFAYVADITPPGERGRYFGLIGAISGIGFILGPAVGGLAARLGLEAPFYIAAALTLANVLLGLFFMPESLPRERRLEKVSVAALNPFGVLRNVAATRELRWLLAASFLYVLPFAALTSNIGLFGKDVLHWDAAMAGTLFALVGVSDIVIQGLLLQWLLRHFSEAKVAIAGLVIELVAYLLVAADTALLSTPLLYVGVFLVAMGDGLLGPAFNGLLTRAAGERSQGQVQGGNQSVQSLGRIIGPLAGGEVYDRFGRATPYVSGAVIGTLAIVSIVMALPGLPSAAKSEKATSAAD